VLSTEDPVVEGDIREMEFDELGILLSLKKQALDMESSRCKKMVDLTMSLFARLYKWNTKHDRIIL
jgi:hypothetical protein